MEIKLAKLDHWEEIKRIYISGIETKNATFETAANVKDGKAWFTGKTADSTFIAAENNNILGFVALSPVSDRCVYAGVAEVSVYIDPTAQGKGIGSKLLERIIEFSENNNIWTIQAGIMSENIASIKLHQKHGFRIIGEREKLGKLDGIWRNVVLMERRSKTIF